MITQLCLHYLLLFFSFFFFLFFLFIKIWFYTIVTLYIIFSFHCTGTSSCDGLVNEKTQIHVFVPPEILVYINVSVDVLRTFYLLPALMHRLESLMLASQLRGEISCPSRDFQISSSLVCPIVGLIYWLDSSNF